MDLRAFYSGKKVFLTGHTGFKGSWLALWLRELGAEVTGYALPPKTDQDHFTLLGLADRVTHIEGDIRDADKLAAAMSDANPDIVFHLAAQALVRQSIANPLETFSTNVQGSASLLNAVRNCGSVKALVYITSDKCYLNKEWVWGYREGDELGGHDPYSASKAAAENVFYAFQKTYFESREGFAAATTRAGNVIGGGDWSEDRLLPDCIRALKAGEPIVIRSPAATRPWQYVLDPLRGYMMLAANLVENPEKFRGSWNFGPVDRHPLPVKKVTELVIDAWGKGELRVEADPNAGHEANLLQLSIDKARDHLDWYPVFSGTEAVTETADWYKRINNGDDPIETSRASLARYIEQIDR